MSVSLLVCLSMERYKEVANQTFHFQTKSTMYGLFADLMNTQDQAIMPFQQFGERGLCHLRILQKGKRTTVIAIEIPVNPGKSVTNAAEDIATQVVQQFHLDPMKTRFIECYSKDSYEGARAETYDEVTFTWQERKASNPQWRRLEPHEIAELLDVE